MVTSLLLSFKTVIPLLVSVEAKAGYLYVSWDRMGVGDSFRLGKLYAKDWQKMIDDIHLETWTSFPKKGNGWKVSWTSNGKRHNAHGNLSHPSSWYAFLIAMDFLVPEVGLVHNDDVVTLRLNYVDDSCEEVFIVDRPNSSLSYESHGLDGSGAWYVQRFPMALESLFQGEATRLLSWKYGELREAKPGMALFVKTLDGNEKNLTSAYSRASLPPEWDGFLQLLKDNARSSRMIGKLFEKHTYRYGVKDGEYIYVMVSFSKGGKYYSYVTDDDSIRPGDRVLIPVGENHSEQVRRVEAIVYALPGEEPYPRDKTKQIVRKLRKDEGAGLRKCPVCDKMIDGLCCGKVNLFLKTGNYTQPLPSWVFSAPHEKLVRLCSSCVFSS